MLLLIWDRLEATEGILLSIEMIARTSLTNILFSKALQCCIVYATDINSFAYMYNHIGLYLLQSIDKIPFKVVMIDK